MERAAGGPAVAEVMGVSLLLRKEETINLLLLGGRLLLGGLLLGGLLLRCGLLGSRLLGSLLLRCGLIRERAGGRGGERTKVSETSVGAGARVGHAKSREGALGPASRSEREGGQRVQNAPSSWWPSWRPASWRPASWR